MSAQKQITLGNGVSGNFICRVESVTVRNKPDQVKIAIVNWAWYANETQKNANNPIEQGSKDMDVTLFSVDKAPIDVAYSELKKPGMMLENSSEC